jgi:hypothetical protein
MQDAELMIKVFGLLVSSNLQLLRVLGVPMAGLSLTRDR